MSVARLPVPLTYEAAKTWGERPLGSAAPVGSERRASRPSSYWSRGKAWWLPYHLTTLPPHHLTTLPPHHLTTLPPHHLTTLPSDHLTNSPPDCPTALLPLLTLPSENSDVTRWASTWNCRTCFIGQYSYVQ